MNVAEVAQYWGVNKQTVREWHKDGVLSTGGTISGQGRALWFDRDEVEGLHRPSARAGRGSEGS